MRHTIDYKIFYGPADAELEQVADQIEPLLKKFPDACYHKVLSILAYRNPWRPKRVGWINVLDQILHFCYAVIILLPILVSPSFFTAGLSGFILGAVREWEQWKEVDLKILMFWDRLLDAGFFALGGICLYWLKTTWIG